MRRLSKWCIATALSAVVSVISLTETKAEFADDFRFWNEFLWKQYKDDHWLAYAYAELRWVNDASYIGTWVLQQKAYYQANNWLQLGGGPAWIEVEQPTGGWNSLARIELEANLISKRKTGSMIGLINRLETRWWESRDWDTEFVSRHRILYSRTANWLPRMAWFEFSNEIFFDYNQGRFNENRFRPANLFFKMTEKSTINVFAQLRSIRSVTDGRWNHAYIMGTGLRW